MLDRAVYSGAAPASSGEARRADEACVAGVHRRSAAQRVARRHRPGPQRRTDAPYGEADLALQGGACDRRGAARSGWRQATSARSQTRSTLVRSPRARGPATKASSGGAADQGMRLSGIRRRTPSGCCSVRRSRRRAPSARGGPAWAKGRFSDRGTAGDEQVHDSTRWRRAATPHAASPAAPGASGRRSWLIVIAVRLVARSAIWR